MIRLGIIVKTGSGWAVRGNGFEVQGLDEFLNLPEVQQDIKYLERFGDKWRVVRIDDNPNVANVVVHHGNYV